MAAFIAIGCPWPQPRTRRTFASRVCVCSAAEPEPPRDPGSLRSESSRRRNSAPKPLRRRRRRRADDDEELDWAQMDSVPLVGARTPPESGEDYWVDLGESGVTPPRRASRGVGKSMEKRLRAETVAPYTQNWVLWAVIGVGVTALVFKLAGGFDTIPVIPVPDL